MLKTLILVAITGITAAFSGTVFAGTGNAPEQPPDIQLHNGVMLLSTLPGFSGNVQKVQWYSNQCYPVPSSMGNSVQAADPQPYDSHANCYLYRQVLCEGERTPVLIDPGYDNFAAHGIYGPWTSFWCTCGGACEPNSTEHKTGAPNSIPSKRDDTSSPSIVKSRKAGGGPSMRQRASQFDTHLNLCSEPDYKGSCSNVAANLNTCVNIPAPLSQVIQSAGPDCGAGCTLYSNLGCQGYTSSEIWYPGLQDTNILDKGVVWNSFECTADASAQCPTLSERADAEARRNTALEVARVPDAHLLLCSEPNYTGKCRKLGAFWGTCTPIPADLGNSIQSTRPEQPELELLASCYLHSNKDCQGYESGLIRDPGVADTNIWDKGRSWASFECDTLVIA